MGCYTSVQTNLLVNQLTYLNTIRKLYTKVQYNKLILELERRQGRLTREDIILQLSDNNYLIFNSNFKNYEGELDLANELILKYFPRAEGTQLILEEEKTPRIYYFANQERKEADIADIKFKQKDDMIIPYYKTTFDIEIKDEEDLQNIRSQLRETPEAMDFLLCEELLEKYITFNTPQR